MCVFVCVEFERELPIQGVSIQFRFYDSSHHGIPRFFRCLCFFPAGKHRAQYSTEAMKPIELCLMSYVLC